MSISVNKERSAYWDNLKGFLILLVVFAHILDPFKAGFSAVHKTVDIIYMFHMPAFVFISGYFGKSERSRSFESIIKLIFLYFIFNSLMCFIYGYQSLLAPVYSSWYLLALIIWRITAPRIAGAKEIMLILFTVALFVGFYPSIDNTFAAARTICFYPFYMSGYLLSPEKSGALINKRYAVRAGVGVLIAAVTLAGAFAAYDFFNYPERALLMGSYGEPKDAFGRIVLYIIAFLAVSALRLLSPDRKIPFLTMFGRNSLWIFLFHRPFTIEVSRLLTTLPLYALMLISAGITAVLCLAFGNDWAAGLFNRFAAGGVSIFTANGKARKFSVSKLSAVCVALWFVVLVVIDSYSGVDMNDIAKLLKGEYVDTGSESNTVDHIYPAMTDLQKEKFDSAFRISFAGDLILLEDQVKRAYNGSEYDFTDVFEYAKRYISSADYAIGVFEGPMAGEEAGYSSGNFSDNKEFYINFPDSFALAVKEAGFDLVTNANNHLLDRGVAGAMRTIDVLDSIGLDHTGSYKSYEDKRDNRVKLVECQGIKMAVLAYTYGSNGVSYRDLIDGELSYITSLTVSTEGEDFETLKGRVEEDFAAAKALSPDLIIVLPHLGTQFSNEPDDSQKVWFDIFKQNGADIILGDHPHVVEPAFIEEYEGRKVFTAYCPGNFANIYRDDQGDTSMLTEVYIDRASKEVIGGGIVPLYTHARADGNYRAVPIYDIMNDPELRGQLTTDDIALAAGANSIITRVLFEHEMDITSVTERYYFDENGFIRSRSEGLELTEEMKSGILYSAMEKAGTICFIGDSVTEGTQNGGCPWYEPIEGYFGGKQILNYSKGACTVSYMIGRVDEIPPAGLYVIALGTNDVRYRDEKSCAMTAEEYVSRLNELRQKLTERSPSARFVFVAPWYSTDGDPFWNGSFAEKTKLNEEYSAALGEYCAASSADFINANGYIANALRTAPDREYLLDHIHPNASKGVVMYSEAVLSAQ